MPLCVSFHMNYHHYQHIAAVVLNSRRKAELYDTGKALRVECVSGSPGRGDGGLCKTQVAGPPAQWPRMMTGVDPGALQSCRTAPVILKQAE